MKKNDEIISELLKNGGKKVSDCVVRNINITPQENYTRVSLTLDKEIDGYVANGDGIFEKGKTNIVFVSLYTIVSILKNNDKTCIIANEVLENPKALNVILSRAKIALIQEEVSAGTEYVNPWATNPEPKPLENDAIINHLIDITPSEYALSKIDKYADSLLGF